VIGHKIDRFSVKDMAETVKRLKDIQVKISRSPQRSLKRKRNNRKLGDGDDLD